MTPLKFTRQFYNLFIQKSLFYGQGPWKKTYLIWPGWIVIWPVSDCSCLVPAQSISLSAMLLKSPKGYWSSAVPSSLLSAIKEDQFQFSSIPLLFPVISSSFVPKWVLICKCFFSVKYGYLTFGLAPPYSRDLCTLPLVKPMLWSFELWVCGNWYLLGKN
jgi:hypothetical protein